MDDQTLLNKDKEKNDGKKRRYTALIVVGILTGVYSIIEIAISQHLNSITLLSDGIHNLSDVISLVIAFWALMKSTSTKKDIMTYGWRRTEILGAVMNGCFLVSLCVYIVIEAIPRLIRTTPIEGDWWFISVAAAGLGVNTLGTILFCIISGGHGHVHIGGGGHGHSHGDDDIHKKKKEKHGHGHGEGHGHEGHGHEGHGHEGHGHEGHGHEGHGHEGHGHKKKKKDVNIHAVFLHYLGDALSSIVVLIAGLLVRFFGNQTWTEYLDPISSLIIVGLIFWTTIPLLKGCSQILLQQTPSNLHLPSLREKLKDVELVKGIHDLHIWQLVDDMVIATLHVKMLESDSGQFNETSLKIKKILHKFGIHSSTIQPEYIIAESKSELFGCDNNCIKNCEEDWCCKSEDSKVFLLEDVLKDDYSTFMI